MPVSAFVLHHSMLQPCPLCVVAEQRIKELEAERDAYVDVKNDTLGKLWAAEARLAAAERVVEAIRAVQRFDRHHPTARFSRDICGGPEPFGSFVPQIARCAVCEVLAAAERVVETGLRWMQDPNNGALQDEHADALERRIKELEAELFEANQHRVDEAVLGDISRLAETEARLAAAERVVEAARAYDSEGVIHQADSLHDALAAYDSQNLNVGATRLNEVTDARSTDLNSAKGDGSK